MVLQPIFKLKTNDSLVSSGFETNRRKLRVTPTATSGKSEKSQNNNYCLMSLDFYI